MRYNQKIQIIISYSIYLTFFIMFTLIPQFSIVKIGSVEFTIVPLIVSICIYHLKKIGIIFAFSSWGILTFIAALSYGTIFLNYGLGATFLILTISRLILGILIFCLYIFLDKFINKLYLKLLITTLCISFFNTFLVLLFWQFFIQNGFYEIFIVIFPTLTFNIILEWIILPFVSIWFAPLIQALNKHYAIKGKHEKNNFSY